MVDRAALQPLARGYRAVTPEPARAAVSNVFGNLEDVVSVVNHLLQGQFARASSDLMRVALNSTLGLGGLIDIATRLACPRTRLALAKPWAAGATRTAPMWCCRCWGLPPCATR